MKDLQLCGLGNALVDVEFQLSDADFDALNLQRGTMTLVDAAAQRAYIDGLAHHTPHRSSGGSAANTIIAFGQFGGRGAYKAVLGHDEMGLFYAREFTDLGIHLEADLLPHTHTGTCLVLITPDAERTMLTALGVNSTFSAEHVIEATIARSEWLYIEGYKFSEPSGQSAISEAIGYAKKHGTKIAVSFSDTFIINFFRDGLESALAHADLIFCNEMEGCAYTGAEDSAAAFEKLSAQFTNVCFTKGSKGSLVQWNGEVHEIPSFPVTPIDSTGAGDMYAAGFLYGITHGHSADKAGRLASYAASKVVSQFGARLKESHIAVRDEVLGA